MKYGSTSHDREIKIAQKSHQVVYIDKTAITIKPFTVINGLLL